LCSRLDDQLTPVIVVVVGVDVSTVVVVDTSKLVFVVKFLLVLAKGGPVMGDLVPAKVPLVLHHLAALLAAYLASDAVHVQDVLFQVKLVGEHSLAVIAGGRLSRLPVCAGVVRRRQTLPVRTHRRGRPSRTPRMSRTASRHPVRRVGQRNRHAAIGGRNIGGSSGRHDGRDGHEGRAVAVGRV
jgi:hypothetical protein